MIAPANRAKIDGWIGEAPEFRRVETEPLANDAWETRATEDGQVMFTEVDVDVDQPILRLLADWCQEHTKPRVKPPVKTSGGANDVPLRRVGKR